MFDVKNIIQLILDKHNALFVWAFTFLTLDVYYVTWLTFLEALLCVNPLLFPHFCTQ